MISDSGDVVAVAPPVVQPAAETRPEVETEAKEKEVKEEKEPGKDEPAKEKKARVGKPKQAKTASHPPYFQMITEAISSLNEKSGSSPHAIAKFVEGKHKSVLPANFRKMLSLQLKNSAARGKLVKVRASYKLVSQPAATAATKSKPQKKTAKTRTAAAPKKFTNSSTATTKAARANAANLDQSAKTTGRRSKRARSKSVNQIESKIASGGAAGSRRTRKPAPATKARQPKSIRKGKKTAAA